MESDSQEVSVQLRLARSRGGLSTCEDPSTRTRARKGRGCAVLLLVSSVQLTSFEDEVSPYIILILIIVHKEALGFQPESSRVRAGHKIVKNQIEATSDGNSARKVCTVLLRK